MVTLFIETRGNVGKSRAQVTTIIRRRATKEGRRVGEQRSEERKKLGRMSKWRVL